MDTLDEARDCAAKARRWISSVFRSRLGNALVLVNALVLARGAILAYPYVCDHTDCLLVGDPNEFFCYVSPSAITVLYHLVHLPTWIVAGSIEWLFRSNWDQLCTATAFHLETALFLWISCIQWLLVGAYLERWFDRTRLARELRARCVVSPEPVMLNLSDSPTAVAQPVTSCSFGHSHELRDVL